MNREEIKVKISNNKLENYLLSESHPQGRSKAALFQKFGFDLDNSEALKEKLLKIFRQGKLIDKIENKYGYKYVIIGEIEVKPDKKVELTTIWIKEYSFNYIRLVTAYPAGVE